MNSSHDKIQENVLEKIRTSEVRMRPRFYFVLKVVLLVLVVAAILFVSSVIFSFIIFTVRVSGHLFLFGFGNRGFLAFLLLFPWKFLLIDFVLILGLEWLVKQFRFGYRSPLAVLLGSIFVITIVIGFVIDSSHVHEMLLKRADRNELPFFGDTYEHLRRPAPEQGVIEGIIQDASGTAFSFVSAGPLGTSTILWQGTLPEGVTADMLHPGDHVLVAGDLLSSSSIRVYGVKKIDFLPDPDPLPVK